MFIYRNIEDNVSQIVLHMHLSKCMDVIEFDSISKGITWFVRPGPTAESKN